MGQILLLEEIAIIAATSVLVTVALGRMKLPTTAGLLFSGALLGPHGLKLASDAHAIETIAEVGVVFLLFTIGLEFSLGRLKHIFRRVALGGILQVGITILTVTYIARWWGYPLGEALFYGFVFALSSTALVLRELSERQELDAPHGRFIVGTLIFQDLCVVPMVLMVPLLAEVGEGGTAFAEMGFALGKASLVVVGLMAGSRLIAPRVLGWVAASGSREVFILAVLSLCIGTAWLTSLAGLSLALGAFLGGMVVADTEYSHRAMGDILPLRHVFVSFFFVSLGMFFDVGVVIEHGAEVALFLAAFIIGKGCIATLAALAMRFPARAAWLAGVGLAQFGEFGFVLVQIATQEGVVDAEGVQPLLIAGILSMFLTPLLILKAPHITAGERVLGPLARLLRARSIDQLDSVQPGLANHVVVIGYGLAGELVTRALHNLDVEHVVLEMNAENVTAGRERGHPVYYADATSAEALGHAHVGNARAVIVMINDPSATRRVVDAISRLVPTIPIFVRTEYLGQAAGFIDLGASDVVASEVEGGLEVLARVLRELEVPRNVLEAEVDKARRRTQRSARQFVVPRPVLGQHTALSELKVESVTVVEGSPAAHQSPRALDLARKSGALVVALTRDGELLTTDLADQPLRPGDVVYLIGKLTAVDEATKTLGRPA
jgi:CPA2 family monovalent cation:H+ antiporter-2